MRMTRAEFEDAYERLDYTEVATRRSLVQRAFLDGLLNERTRQIWLDRIAAEAAPMRQNVVEVDLGYVEIKNTEDPTRPNDRSLPPIRPRPDGIDEFRKHANATPPKPKAAASFQPLGPYVEVRYP